jgi:hypothetical protein
MDVGVENGLASESPTVRADVEVCCAVFFAQDFADRTHQIKAGHQFLVAEV